ncbi:MAG: DUF2934 domain-containing protein [Nitrospira sp.]|nr:DUF2934 domain-containing protein [Nitrospira sp.]
MKLLSTSKPRGKSSVDSSICDPIAADATPSGSSNDRETTDVQARIAVLAYEFYEQRGCLDGHDIEDWVMAEQRVLTDRDFQTIEERRP